MLDTVVQFSRLNIHEVYRLPALEFFAYANYVRVREQRKADEIRKIRRQ